jgi:hypothetical protein
MLARRNAGLLDWLKGKAHLHRRLLGIDRRQDGFPVQHCPGLSSILKQLLNLHTHAHAHQERESITPIIAVLAEKSDEEERNEEGLDSEERLAESQAGPRHEHLIL